MDTFSFTQICPSLSRRMTGGPLLNFIEERNETHEGKHARTRTANTGTDRLFLHHVALEEKRSSVRKYKGTGFAAEGVVRMINLINHQCLIMPCC